MEKKLVSLKGMGDGVRINIDDTADGWAVSSRLRLQIFKRIFSRNHHRYRNGGVSLPPLLQEA